MKTIKCLITILAITASVAAWGQQENGSKEAYPGYFECHTIAERAVEHMLPAKEAVDSTSYLLGVNYGIMFKGNNFFDTFEQVNISRLLTGFETALEIGEPSIPYGYDTEWANHFEISPYEINTHLNEYLEARKTGNAISKETVASTCYLLGVNYGLMLSGNGMFSDFKEVNIMEFLTGISTAMEAGNPEGTSGEDTEWAAKFKISPYLMNSTLNNFIAYRNNYTKELNAQIQEYFFMVNAKRDGVKETESGLQYILHSAGEGEKVVPTDHITVNYAGYFLDGTEFDANENTEFTANQVIQGWTEGLGLIGVGGKITLFIPSHLAYGETGIKSSVEPNAALVFDIELLSIEHNTSKNKE